MDGAIAQAVVGIVGELMASGQRAEAEAELKRLQGEFRGIALPSLEEIEAQVLGDTALAGIQTDPTLEAEQYEALAQVDELSQTGTGIQDRAALNTIANQLGRRSRAAAAGIEADMAGRGLAGSGVDYATRAQMGSDANQRMSEASQNIAGDAANRRVMAMMAKGDLSGRMRGQQYSEKANAAQARDAIMRFNAQSRDSANRFNQGQRQQRFQNQMQRQSAISNPTQAIAAHKNQNAQDTRQLYGNMGAAANSAISTGNTWGNSNLDGYATNDISDDEENIRRGRKLDEEDWK